MAQVLAAPAAIIKVNGVILGFMRSISCNEDIQSGDVVGIGNLTPQEFPVLSWRGTLQCDGYTIDFNKSLVPKAINREVNSVQEFVDYLTLRCELITLEVYKKTADCSNLNELIKQEKVFAIISGLQIQGEGFNLSENQISGRNQSFKYLNPIIYPK